MESEGSQQRVFFVRLALGLGQGLALYLIYSAFDQKVWPATEPLLFAPLVIVALFIPLMLSQGLGNVRAITLIVWTALATAVVAGLAWYDIWRAWPGETVDAIPSARTFLICGSFLFVAHALVSCGDADRRIVAHYPTLFDLAWKLGVQVGIIVCFVLAFWIMLWLGIGLFDMIKLGGFGRFIAHPWVFIPLTTIAAAAAIHVTDARATLVRGVRTLALTLLGWLLPVIALIAFAFLISLVFTGLTPLWETRSATFLLMAAAAVLVIHINAAYQDGDPERRPPHILRVAGTLASVLLIFIIWIAGTALWLRVSQYGWTVDRITSAAAVAVGGMFAVGYLIAAILPGMWLKLIERWNVYGTIVFLIVLFALSTPIADPMRLSVDSQVARLQSGAVKPDKFDFAYLRRDGGRFGHAALVSLANVRETHEAASEALKAANIYVGFLPKKHAPKDIAAAITVHPAGKALPPSFVQQDWGKLDPFELGILNECLSASGDNRCDSVVSDLDGDGSDEVILVYAQQKSLWSATAFRLHDNGWRPAGRIDANQCMSQRDLLLAGSFKPVRPQNPVSDLQIGPDRVAVQQSEASGETCGGKPLVSNFGP